MKRSNTSSAGAAKPMAWNPGGHPIRKVEDPTSSKLNCSSFAAQPVAEMAEDDAAQRPGDETDGIGSRTRR